MTRFNVRPIRCDTPQALRAAMESLGCDPRGIRIMLPKGRFFLLRADGVPFAAASILKQEMLSKGGEAALSGEIYYGGERTTGVLLMGTERTFKRVLRVLAAQPLPSLRELGNELASVLRSWQQPEYSDLQIGDRCFVWGERTYVMGIVNVTPDSFSGDGLLPSDASDTEVIRAAVSQALLFLEQGADLIDIGGESTRPGSEPIDAKTEMGRIVPVIEALRAQTRAPISVDTYKAAVAQAALDVGADMVNDVWGLQMDPAMAPLVAERQVPVIIMHNRSKPRNAAQEQRLGGRYVGIAYENLMGDIIRELRAQVDRGMAAGIARERMIVDPGIGFGKTVAQNLYLLNHVDELRALGLPILLGPSRKSFIGYTLDLPPDERLEGTAAAVAIGILRRGCDIVRVHDVQAMVRVVRMTDAILRAEV